MENNQPKYYTYITDLPLSKFIEALCDGNLYALVKSGDADKEELLIVWDDLLLQYSDAIGDSETRLYMTLFNEVENEKITIKQVEMCIQILDAHNRFGMPYEELYKKDLNKFNSSNFEFDISDPVKFNDELSKSRKRANALNLNFRVKKERFDTLEKKVKEGKKPDRKYFQDVLISISDHSKYEINDNISVYAFCERMRRYKSYIDTLEQQQNKSKK